MPIQHLKLYHAPASRSVRVKWLLHELLGNAFEVARVDLCAAEQYTDAFLRINPNHGVPVLEITRNDGSVSWLIESAAIVTFLADAYPEASLAPPPGASAARADYLQMLHFAATWMDMMLWQIRAHEHVLPHAEQHPPTIARYRNKFLTEVEPQLIARLQRAPFACGDTFSAADCVLGHTIFWARGYGLCRDQVFRDYMSRLSQRAAFTAAFADAREFVLDVRPHPLSQHFTG
ncbi:glutathione S-transferase family protein [Viridibacterium curvum]|uniref:Glutathione S-transferase family protein n=1 Tax=Viridibacterium curvum TaxID=1101404 RepID=A0ABP9QP14_9RHOO